VKLVQTSAKTAREYVEHQTGWQRAHVEALRAVVLEAAPELDECVKWGHLVYASNGPVLLLRAEPARVLFGFWRGKRLKAIEARLSGGGKYEMATLELVKDTPLRRDTALSLVKEAVRLNRVLGDPTGASGTQAKGPQRVRRTPGP